jgi:predicted esterase
VKRLQDFEEEKWTFTSFAQLEGIVRRPEAPTEVILLLPTLPENALVIAPNGPFPIPRPKENRLDYGHSWYFYDKIEKKYFVNQDLAKFWLRDLLHILNPNKLPLTIIGFSQGGYLAPLAGEVIQETKLVVGIACEFRTTLIKKQLPFPLVAIHGSADEIIKPEGALLEIDQLKPLGITVDWQLVEAGHEINGHVSEAVAKTLEKYGKRSL